MKQLAAFEAPGGDPVVVEVDERDPGYDRVARGAGELVVDTGRQLGSALDVVRPTAEALIERVAMLEERPGTVEVQFGIRLNAQVGAVIASTQAEGHIQVKLTWISRRSNGSNGV